MKPNKFLVVGPTFLDINVFLGELETLKSKAVMAVGGKGYNVAHGLQILGIPTILATMYGQDGVGKFIHKKLEEIGLETLDSNKVDFPTGIYVGVLGDVGEEIFGKAQIDIIEKQNMPVVNWADIGMVLMMSSTRDEIFGEILKAKERYGFRLGIEVSGSKSIDSVVKYIRGFDFMICNRKEALAIGERWGVGGVDEVINKFREAGGETIVVTMGREGVVAWSREGGKEERYQLFSKASEGIVSTTGAGDSVTATFCGLHYGKRMGIQESLELAMVVAAEIVKQKDPTLAKLPKEVERSIKT